MQPTAPHALNVGLFPVNRPPWNPKRRISVFKTVSRKDATQVFGLVQDYGWTFMVEDCLNTAGNKAEEQAEHRKRVEQERNIVH
jgi:hypothetical protein